MMLSDRRDAGRQLAKRLLLRNYENPVVLALPRGGVPVGYEIALALAAPLDLILVRKIGAPQQEELAVGAIADGDQPEWVTDPQRIQDLGITEVYFDQAKATALREIERRRRAYCGDRSPADVAGRTAIVVDDGIATGSTMRAALLAVRRRKPAKLVLVVPVAPDDTLRRLCHDVDEVVCLETPADFYAVGQFYEDFSQLRDEEVTALLTQAHALVRPCVNQGKCR